MKIVCMSDSHNQTDWEMPDGDILVHAGDLTMGGHRFEVIKVLDWLEKQTKRYAHVVFIGGNHDFLLESEPEWILDASNKRGLTYLNDTSITIDGLKFHGSPITPWFHNWAFNRFRGEQIQKHWNMIPDDTDVLITHGPPYMILDECRNGHVGCEQLWRRILEVRPQLHVFGHIHEQGGRIETFDGIKFINACVLDGRYQYGREPMEIEI